MTSYHSEREFLDHYNSDEYGRVSVTADVLVFSVSNEEPDNYYPFKDMWCLPGGFVASDEHLDDCPKRILKNETNLTNIYLEQLYTFGHVNRDPRMRIVSTAYLSLVNKNLLSQSVSENSEWFNLGETQADGVTTITLTGSKTEFEFSVAKTAQDKNHFQYSYQITENKHLAFDHALVIAMGIDRLRNKIGYSDIVFHMMPQLFTLGELQQVYETILNKSLLTPSFRRIIANKVEKTEQIQKGKGHRPSVLFRYKSKNEQSTDF